jgi:hypothetical protein
MGGAIDLPGSMMPLDFQEAGMPGAMLDKKEAFQIALKKSI